MNWNIYLDNNAKIKVVVLDTSNLFSDLSSAFNNRANFNNRKVLSNLLLNKKYWINKAS